MSCKEELWNNNLDKIENILIIIFTDNKLKLCSINLANCSIFLTLSSLLFCKIVLI